MLHLARKGEKGEKGGGGGEVGEDSTRHGILSVCEKTVAVCPAKEAKSRKKKKKKKCLLGTIIISTTFVFTPHHLELLGAHSGG